MHNYELSLFPTLVQAAALTRLGRLELELLVEVAAQLAGQGLGRREAPQQPALTGPGIVTPLSPGFILVAGVPGPIAAGTGNPQQLPRWAREVLEREYSPAQPGTLVSWVPALQRAQRIDWVDIRQEPYGWVLELEFNWADYPARGLTWTELQDRPHDATLRRLMV